MRRLGSTCEDPGVEAQCESRYKRRDFRHRGSCHFVAARNSSHDIGAAPPKRACAPAPGGTGDAQAMRCDAQLHPTVDADVVDFAGPLMRSGRLTTNPTYFLPQTAVRRLQTRC